MKRLVLAATAALFIGLATVSAHHNPVSNSPIPLCAPDVPDCPLGGPR